MSFLIATKVSNALTVVDKSRASSLDYYLFAKLLVRVLLRRRTEGVGQATNRAVVSSLACVTVNYFL